MNDGVKTREHLLAEVAELRKEMTEFKRTGGISEGEGHRDEYYRRIEDLVEERTAEIRIVNRQLHGEIESRKRAEEKLQVVAGQWRDTLDAIPDAVWLMDADQTILRCNKAASKLLKSEYGGIIGKKCYELVHKGASPIEGCPFLRMYSSKRRETVHLPVEDRWLKVSVTPVKTGGGKITGAIHVISDVSKERRAREELKESRKRLSEMIDGIGDGFLALDKVLRLTYVNKRAEKLLGRNDGELIGKAVGDALPGEAGVELEKACLEALKKGRSQSAGLFFSTRPARIEARITHYGGGLTVCLHDITEQKKKEG